MDREGNVQWPLSGGDDDGLGTDALQAPQQAGQGVDLGHRPLDDERDDGHVAVVEGQPLPTQHYRRVPGNEFVDCRHVLPVVYEYRDRSYSLLHQVLGFWIRLMVNGAKIQNKNDCTNFFSSGPADSLLSAENPAHILIIIS